MSLSEYSTIRMHPSVYFLYCCIFSLLVILYLLVVFGFYCKLYDGCFYRFIYTNCVHINIWVCVCVSTSLYVMMLLHLSIWLQTLVLVWSLFQLMLIFNGMLDSSPSFHSHSNLHQHINITMIKSIQAISFNSDIQRCLSYIHSGTNVLYTFE